MTWLNTLEPKQTVGSIGLFHASPVDPIWHYVFTDTDAHRAFFRLGDELQVCLVGHSHLQLAFTETELNAWPHRQGDNLGIMNQIVTVHRPQRLLANPGSCGQPRNGHEHQSN
jgi:diadenosine tetraphosphatase ApaH/serine/threonine PP2A family protein phosphatase